MKQQKNRGPTLNLWNVPGVPQKAWSEIGNFDMREEGARDRSEYATCDMCGQTGVRHLRELKHADYHRTLKVGRTCASKLVELYADGRTLRRMVAVVAAEA